MGSAFAMVVNDLDEQAFQALYGRWDPLDPAQVAELFGASPVRWWIAGGRAARAGAPDRHHDDTGVAVRFDDLDRLRHDLSAWHLWEANSGTLRPLLPGAQLTGGCEQLWARRDAQRPSLGEVEQLALGRPCQHGRRPAASPPDRPRQRS
jgi:hypothetical protein